MSKQRPNHNLNGRTRKKRGLGNWESPGSATQNKSECKELLDPFHNGSIPCCRLLNDAIEDIFPELKGHGNFDYSNSLQQPQHEPGSALGQMFRRRLLLSRKMFQTPFDKLIEKEKVNEDRSFEHNKNSANFQNNTTTNSQTASTTAAKTTAAKKKRKRKKKKRQDLLPLMVTTHENNTNEFGTKTYSSSRNGIESYANDGKSMMSITDHSVEALDEAVKIEAEKMIELEANHEFPLLEALPSDDNVQAQESPSQFIDQIKPQDDNLFQDLLDHANQLPLTDPTENIVIPSSLPADSTENDDSSELAFQNPLQLPFLVNVEGKEEDFGCGGDETQVKCRDGKVPEGPRNFTTILSDKERAQILLYQWIDQFLSDTDEFKCIETPITKGHQDAPDPQNNEWDPFIQFCNERTVGREKALGISFADLLAVGSSIECQICRKDALAEINKIAGKATSEASAPSRVVVNPTLLENPSSAMNNEMNVDSAFDYIAMEEENHICDSVDEEKSDSNLSLLALNVSIDLKHKKLASKSSSKKRNPVGNGAATEQCFFLETLTLKQVEEFLYEWLIAGVDEEKLAQMSFRKETGPHESGIDRTSFPHVTSENEFQLIRKRVIGTQSSFKKSLDDVNEKLEKRRQALISENQSPSTEMNLNFSGTKTMDCEAKCNDILAGLFLPILTGELSNPSCACAELQIYLWTLYLEFLGKTISAFDAYYKKLEEEVTDQNGILHNLFTSARRRSLNREIVKEKIELLLELGSSFSKVTTSSSMREFYLRASWEQCKRVEQDESCEKLDEDCRELITALTEWTRLVNGGRMSDFYKERRKRLMNVFDMLRVVVDSLGEEYKVVKRYFSQECQKYFDWLLSSIHLAHGVKHRMRLVEIDDVVSMTTGVILMWRHVRIMQRRVARSVAVETLPLSLRKWVLESHINDLEHSKCWRDFGGKRRSMGIMAGLAYVWLRERCEEWKAEIASQELLTYLDTDLFSSDDKQLVNGSKSSNKTGGLTTKSNKKTKKKKNKKLIPEDNGYTSNHASSAQEEIKAAKSGDDLSIESAEVLCIAVDKSSGAAKPELTGDVQIPTAKSNIKDEKLTGIDIVDGLNFDSVTTLSEEKEEEDTLIAEETKGSIGDTSVEVLHCEKEDNGSTRAFESSVVVQDEKGCILPAMEFLTDRLVELMRQSENEKIVIIPN